MIHVRQLTKEYSDIRNGKFTALNGVSFDAMSGEIFGLLGPNGAGKTTALRILSTVLKPTSGHAKINGIDVVAHPERVRYQIGFVSTNTAIYDRMTGFEMVEYFGRLYGLPDGLIYERIETIFARFQMNNIRDMLCSKNVDRHETEGINRSRVDSRSTGVDLRRSDIRVRRTGGARSNEDS